MNFILKEKLEEYLKTQNKTILAVEKEAGLPLQSLYNILINRSRNPKLETIIKVADILDCSVDEIIGRPQYTPQISSKRLHDLPSNYALFQSIYIYVDEFLKNHSFDFNVANTIYCIEEIYKYSIKSDIKLLDIKFADWILNKIFKN